MEEHDTELEVKKARRFIITINTVLFPLQQIFHRSNARLYINRYIQGQLGGLGPKNDVLKTIKAFTMWGGQRVIAADFRKEIF